MLDRDSPIGKCCRRCGRPARHPSACWREWLCKRCHQCKEARVGRKPQTGLTPVGGMTMADPGREERIAIYAARAVMGLPLFDGVRGRGCVA